MLCALLVDCNNRRIVLLNDRFGLHAGKKLAGRAGKGYYGPGRKSQVSLRGMLK